MISSKKFKRRILNKSMENQNEIGVGWNKFRVEIITKEEAQLYYKEGISFRSGQPYTLPFGFILILPPGTPPSLLVHPKGCKLELEIERAFFIPHPPFAGKTLLEKLKSFISFLYGPEGPTPITIYKYECDGRVIKAEIVFEEAPPWVVFGGDPTYYISGDLEQMQKEGKIRIIRRFEKQEI